MYADKLLRPWFEPLRADFADLQIYDCHTHVGRNDPSGFTATLPQLLESLEFVDGRAAVFPLKEPAGYGEANLALAHAAVETDGRLVAFARLEPGDRPAVRAQQALDAGARGLKLHPAGDEFELSDVRLTTTWELADEQRLPVVIHAGPELDTVGRTVLSRAHRYPGARLIVAHAAVVDLAWLWREVQDVTNLFFDTSWWSPSDVLALLSLVPASQVLTASDLPYATPLWAAATTLRCGVELGLSREQIGSVLGAQFARLVERGEPIRFDAQQRPTAPPLDPLLERTYTYLSAALEATHRGEDPGQLLSLAQHAVKVSDDYPEAEVMASIAELLELYLRHRGELHTDNQFAPGWDLIAAAVLTARTPRGTSALAEVVR
jgi:predicted TIM-barrel fold metal-dependent hydrolase